MKIKFEPKPIEPLLSQLTHKNGFRSKFQHPDNIERDFKFEP